MKYPIAKYISKETKNAIKKAIQETKETGIEHGFIMCSNSEIYPSNKKCTGTNCEIHFDYHEACEKAQGDFHVHPTLSDARKQYYTDSDEGFRDLVTFDEFIDTVKENHTNPTPSFGDLLNTLLLNVYHHSEGTMCIGNDISNDIINCYHISKGISPKYIKKLVNILDNDNKTFTGNPDKELLSHFKKEEVHI